MKAVTMNDTGPLKRKKLQKQVIPEFIVYLYFKQKKITCKGKNKKPHFGIFISSLTWIIVHTNFQSK